MADPAGLVCLTVAYFGLAGQRKRNIVDQPVELAYCQPVSLQIVLGLGDDERVVNVIFCHDVPGCLGQAPNPTDAQSLALADGVIRQANVFAQRYPVVVPDWARFPGQVTLQKIAKASFPNETNTRAVLLAVIVEVGLLRQCSHRWFVHLAYGKEAPLQLLYGYCLQEVALIFVQITAFMQAKTIVCV